MKASGILLIAAVSAASAFSVGPSHAYTFDYTCNGPVGPSAYPYYVKQNLCSIPAGSPQDFAVYNAVVEHNRYTQSDNVRLGTPWSPSYCVVVSNDGNNEVALVARGALDGASGRTYRERNLCLFSQSIVETDVKIANDGPNGVGAMSFSDPNEALLTNDPFYNTGRADMMHEFGHAHGLGHTESFDIMRAAEPHPVHGGTGNHVSLMGDDALGIRAFYGGNATSGLTSANIFASALHLNSATGYLNPNPSNAYWGYTLDVCPGQVITFDITNGNNGAVGVLYNQRIFVNAAPAPAGYTGGWDIGGYVNSYMGAGGYLSFVTAWTIPPYLPRGQILWVYNSVDSGAYEKKAYDNVVQNLLTIRVGSAAVCGW